MKFRAFFNETDAPADDCEALVLDAIRSADGLSLSGETQTIASDYGDVQNITVDFEVHVDEDTLDERSPKGRLLETLLGNESYSGLVGVYDE